MVHGIHGNRAPQCGLKVGTTHTQALLKRRNKWGADGQDGAGSGEQVHVLQHSESHLRVLEAHRTRTTPGPAVASKAKSVQNMPRPQETKKTKADGSEEFDPPLRPGAHPKKCPVQ